MDMAVLFLWGESQQGNFFTRRPEGIRRMIYEHLFGRRKVHIMRKCCFRWTGLVELELELELDADRNPSSVEEGITTLYGSNTLMFQDPPRELAMFEAIASNYTRPVRTLESYVDALNSIIYFDSILANLAKIVFSETIKNIDVRIRLSLTARQLQYRSKPLTTTLQRCQKWWAPLSHCAHITWMLPSGFTLESEVMGLSHVPIESYNEDPTELRKQRFGEPSDDEEYWYMF
ncbi:hypothetical protein F66182_675 [Fusarium sp. NRRL 66182]|nr:hypothetical protein F66182_675 [Fusarium sp. NRRL 66182]